MHVHADGSVRGSWCAWSAYVLLLNGLCQAPDVVGRDLDRVVVVLGQLLELEHLGPQHREGLRVDLILFLVGAADANLRGFASAGHSHTHR